MFGEGAVITSGQGTSIIRVEFGDDCANTSAFIRVTFDDGCDGTTTISQTIDEVCSSFAVFPNPADNQFTVSFSDNEGSESRLNTHSTSARNNVLSEGFEVVLYDQQQRVIRQGSSQDGQASVDVQGLRPGVYVLHILYRGETYPHQVMIE